jgi:hypothetical protein
LSEIHLQRHPILLSPECARVIIRPFVPASAQSIANIIGRALALSEDEVAEELAILHQEFDSRHLDIEGPWMRHYQSLLRPHVFTQKALSKPRELLVGALFSGEYALESAALFNPSIVPHPDQSGVPEGALRFAMSLRATGEGHISSIEFRAGTISPNGSIELEPTSRHVTMPELLPNPTYDKKTFELKFHEMGFDNDYAQAILAPLSETFSRNDLEKSTGTVSLKNQLWTNDLTRTLECVQ